MSKEENLKPKWPFILGAALLILILFRFLVAFRFAILSLLILGAIGFGVYFLYRYFQNKRAKQAFQKSPEGHIQSQIDHFSNLLKENQQEIEDIEASIRDLEHTLQDREELTTQNREQSEELLKGFRAERQLREAKASFYRLGLNKLDRLLHNHRLARQLSAKKDKLEQLREDNYEDLAQLEEMRSRVELDTFHHLGTIEDLSDRLLESSSANDAQHLRRELEEMTRELDRL